MLRKIIHARDLRKLETVALNMTYNCLMQLAEDFTEEEKGILEDMLYELS